VQPFGLRGGLARSALFGGFPVDVELRAPGLTPRRCAGHRLNKIATLMIRNPGKCKTAGAVLSGLAADHDRLAAFREIGCYDRHRSPG